MAFDYQPFLIANMAHGLELGLKPWLLPQDAFAEIINGYLSRGVLYKRKGYEQFGRLVHSVSAEVIGSHNGTTFAGTLAHYPLRAGDLVITDGVEIFSDNGDGTLTGDLGGSGTITYATGVFSVTFNTAPATDPTASYDYYPGLPVMGLFNYTSASGTQDFLGFNTKRLNKYNISSKKFEDILGTDTFTGDDNQFFWMANWLNKGFMTNNKDQIRIYDGSTVTALVLDLTVPPDSVNDVDSCLLLFPYHDRLVLLRTTENGTTYPQRARWTKIGKYDECNPDDWVDAPTHEWIMGAGFIREDLVVWFERSVWRLRYTGDPRLPFVWRRITSNDGLIASMSLADFSNELIGVGPCRLTGTDGSQSYNIDDKIPQYVLVMNQEKMEYCYSGILDQDNLAWWSYVSINSDLPDEVLVLNYDEKSFAVNKLPMFCFGYFDLQGDLTWDDIDQTWDEIEWAWDDRTMQGGYPQLMAGDYYGYIFMMNYGGEDNSADIEFKAKSGRQNPFIKKGKQARLGWVDFLVTRDPSISLTVEYYQNQESAPYLTDTFTLDDGSSNEKIWIRSYVGCEAEFHQFRLYNKASNQTPEIHAIMPWYCRGGSIK